MSQKSEAPSTAVKARAKTCPKCALLNPPSASRCDCGFDLDSQGQEGVRFRSLASAKRTMGFGITIAILGVILTLLTWDRLEGRVYVFYGMVLAGAGIFWRGYSARSRLRE
jgi:hypothetical protein